MGEGVDIEMEFQKKLKLPEIVGLIKIRLGFR